MQYNKSIFYFVTAGSSCSNFLLEQIGWCMREANSPLVAAELGAGEVLEPEGSSIGTCLEKLDKWSKRNIAER